MEKFTLYDLLNKFNDIATPKKSFIQTDSNNKTASDGKTVADNKIKNNNANQLVTPTGSGNPTQYAMNNKMYNFILEHERLSKKIENNKN